ncbi:MAG TPA: hypothetical protein VG498_04115 [Terriglobales bacterium]|nr:hypothetical protein [Terriglobales bacterium]
MKNVSLCWLFLISTAAWAQNPPQTSELPRVMVLGGMGAGSEMGQTNFFYKEVMRGGEFVKGAPYTATAVTEATQVLADGNRIVNKTSAFLARDSEGRTRREETMSNAGPLPLDGAKMIFINDPTTGSEYILNQFEKTADVMKHEGKVISLEQKHVFTAKSGNSGTPPFPKEIGETKSQSLGTEVVEGLNCDHLLTTQTIPAGAIGNERPLVITSETWAAPDLHLLVMRKHNDPRFGETVYKLTNITRGEPDPTLFQIPSNFKVMDGLPPLRSPLQ